MDGIKTCNKCGVEKSFDNFYKKKSKPLARCKQCVGVEQKEYKKHNKEKRKAWFKGYYLRNKEKLDKQSNDNYHNNIEKHKAQRREFRNKNKEMLKERYKQFKMKDIDAFNTMRKEWREKYYIENPDKLQELKKYHKEYLNKNAETLRLKRNARNKIKRKTDMQFKISSCLRTSFKSCVKKERKKSSVLVLIGCKILDFKEFIKSKWKEGMTWENWGQKDTDWHLDHILPIELFNLEDFEQQKICYHYTNFQPLWAVENGRKKDFLPDGRKASKMTGDEKLEYLKSLGYLKDVATETNLISNQI